MTESHGMEPWKVFPMVHVVSMKMPHIAEAGADSAPA